MMKSRCGLLAAVLMLVIGGQPVLSVEKISSASVENVQERDRPYRALIKRHAKKNGVPFDLARAVIEVESNFRANVRGQAGEVGLMQIKPATARAIGFTGTITELFEPETNIKYGMKYLGEAYRLGGGTTCGAILKYNAGHYAKHMNPISARYCEKVKAIIE